MRISTKPYGPIEVEERQLIRFPVGLFGFEGLHEYALLDALQSGFYWLQSIEDEQIAFILLNPYDLRSDYVLDVSDDDLEAIGYEDEQDILAFAIVTIPEDESRISANLQGPVIVNRVRRLGKQAISLNPQWQIKHYILDELAKAGSR